MSLVLRESVLHYGSVTFGPSGNIAEIQTEGKHAGPICYAPFTVDLPGRVAHFTNVYYRESGTDRTHAIGVWGRDHTGKWYMVTTDVPAAVAKQITAMLQERVDFNLSAPRVKLPRSKEDRNVERLAEMCVFTPGVWLYDEKLGYERYFTDGVFFDPYNNGLHQWKLITSAKLNINYRTGVPIAQKEGVSQFVELTSYTSLNIHRQLCDYIVKYCLKD